MKKEMYKLEDELNSKKIPKKYKNNIQDKRNNFWLYIIFFAIVVIAAVTIIILFALSDNYYLQLIDFGNGTLLLIFLLFFPYLIKIIIDKYNIMIMNKHSNKIKKINWTKLFEIYNNNQFIIEEIKLNKLYLTDYLFCKLLLSKKIKAIEINNEFKISFNDLSFSIKFCNISLDKDDNFLLLNKKITFNKIMSLDEIKKVLNINIVEFINVNESSTEVIINTIICSKNELFGNYKSKITYLKMYDFEITKKIFGLYSQKKYNKNNFLETYKIYIENDINTIKDLLILQNSALN
ncbi:hypothetical protein [Spiroplasma cantharicola]|uniref:Uncharacterized protein n=1 Tax=Spiroplasma cantharicola TaxID=362837 RepID=A0A0M4JJH7_9MOLU|nr:hypothetical protein [Spiroplasma cantharicola]ALD66349.1 hypothetical protein SCANT_v1c04430 [Spiroplasma cantharicola]